VLHVSDEFPFIGPDGAGYLPIELEARQRESVAELLKAQTSGLRQRGIETRAVSVLGAPHIRISNVAEAEKADLVIVGSHGRTGLQRLALGSVAERVARTSRVPVLVVRTHSPWNLGRRASGQLAAAA